MSEQLFVNQMFDEKSLYLLLRLELFALTSSRFTSLFTIAYIVSPEIE